ncbi:hypothetical protein DFP72DRAFT_305480 [Ephemerocybe angulata]|uniref:Uncharacterized protein n=1 Tax=Ephemerocybe angulata TaxID=980116 RepID=A0A8H6HZG5_9AGAR|nr:hypothetical protein DFP72DRAFT_305480 [Tulosesus angulatus]
MDSEIPQLLGVSKAVLENVIFCHQEDSYWPLAEPSVLKKKFDDIFEATRYTKALNSIKDLRKDRVAELKAEKERLIGLSREKQHLDKLLGRINDAQTEISLKESEYETAKEDHDRLAEDNRKFYELNSKFREIYKEVENLEKLKARSQQDLEDARVGNFEELPGTDEELALKMSQFSQHIEAQRQVLLREERKKQDAEEDITGLRDQHTDLLSKKGRLSAEAEAHRTRISERENLIRESGKQYNISVPEQKLERDAVVQFMSQIADLQRKHKAEFEQLQADLSEKSNDYFAKIRKLENESQAFKTQRQTLHGQVQERNTSIRNSERQLNGQATLEMTLASTKEEIEEKRSRVEKIRSDIGAAKYDEKMFEKSEQARQLEEKRDVLLEESRALSMQADSRAKLDLKRAEIKAKTSEMQSTQTTISFKFEELAHRQPNPESIQEEIASLLLSKNEEAEETERDAGAAKLAYQQVEKGLADTKADISVKQRRSRELEMEIQKGLKEGEVEAKTVDDAIAEATGELEECKNRQNVSVGSSGVFTTILKTGRQKKICLACNRGLEDDQLEKFETHVRDLMRKSSKEDPDQLKADMKVWQKELDGYNKLKEKEKERTKILDEELPALKAQLAELEASRPDIVSKADMLSDKLEDLKQHIASINDLRMQATTIARLQREIEKTQSEVGDIETDLSMTGSTKTVDDVQNELNEITAELRAIEKDKQNLTR